MRVVRFIAIALAFPSAAVGIAATTQSLTAKLIAPASSAPQKCASPGVGPGAVCVMPMPQQEAIALRRLRGVEAGLSMGTDNSCFVLRTYRFSGNDAGSFNPNQKPEISDCHSAATLQQLPAK